jgi:hypothetical protein
LSTSAPVVTLIIITELAGVDSTGRDFAARPTVHAVSSDLTEDAFITLAIVDMFASIVSAWW